MWQRLYELPAKEEARTITAAERTGDAGDRGDHRRAAGRYARARRPADMSFLI
jgi:hypothetical protein